MGLFDSLSGVLSTLFAPNPDAVTPPVPAPYVPPLVGPIANCVPPQVTVAPNGDTQMRAFLMTIRACEGTDGPDGYRTLFGGKLFDSFAEHPQISTPFTNSNGVLQYTSAAGAYQFLWPTWRTLRAALQLPDFSPASQDAAAIELIRRAGAVDDVQAGRLTVAVSKCASLWASLPGGPYPQSSKPWSFVNNAFQAAGGWISN